MATVPKERRKHPRYRVNKDVLSISQDILAEVLDISASGIGCQCLTNTEKMPIEINEIEILNCELGTSVEDIPCRLVRSSKKTIHNGLTSTMILNLGLEFHGLSESQRKGLRRFIGDNSLHEAAAPH